MANFFCYTLLAVIVASAVADDFIPLGAAPSNPLKRSTSKLLYLSTRTATWGQAWFDCEEAYGGTLVAIENADEDKFIKNSLIANGISTAWTSGIYDGGWRWGLGSLIGTSGYLNWAAGHPYSSSSYAVYVYSSGVLNYKWQTTSQGVSYRYICQK